MKALTRPERLVLCVLGDLRLASPDAGAERLSDAEKLDLLVDDIAGKTVFLGQDGAPLVAPGGRENSWTEGLPAAAAKWRHMPEVSCELPESAPGFVVRAFDDVVLFERLDFATGEGFGDCVRVAMEGAGEALPRLFRVPQFPPDAEALVGEGDGATRSGVSERQVVVRFPTASPVRALDYLVTVRYAEADLVKVAIEKCVLSGGLFRAVDDATAICAFGVDELPWNVDLDFCVVPRNAFGAGGRAIHAKGRVRR